MPAYQTTYPINGAVGYPGMIADTEFTTVFSRQIVVAAAGFGLVVGRGTADGTAQINGTGYEGITIADKAQLNAAGTGYAIGDTAGVMAKGAVWVIASTAVTPTTPVTYTAATGVIGAGLAATITGARFLGTAGIGVLVQVYLG